MATADTLDRIPGDLQRNASAAADSIGRDARHAANTATGVAREAGGAVKNELIDLYNDVLDFVSKPELRNDPDVGAIRQKIERGMSAARESVADATRKVSRQAGHAVHVADEYAHNEPWRVAGMAALVGLALGVLMSRR